MSPVRMEHKFDSLRERRDKRKGINGYLQWYEPQLQFFVKFISPEEFTRSSNYCKIDMIPVCGLGGSVSVQYTIGV